MSDDEDYGSDDIIAQCLAASSSVGKVGREPAANIRGDAPREEKRKRELWKRRLEEDERRQKVKQSKLEKSKQAEVRREEGLSTAIEPENKGFQMLAKMGYKPGSTLGRAPDAVSEPIKIVVKADRGGLGKTEAEKEKRRKLLEAAREQLARREELARDYRSHKSSAMAEKLVAKDLYTSQKACLTQDQEAGIDEPLVSWYWPPGLLATEDEDECAESVEDNDDNMEEMPNSEKLRSLTRHLRENYLYCVWCGIRFSSEEDLAAECPGDTREDH